MLRHCWDIVVSKTELIEQLWHSTEQTTLLRLLMFGKELPDYETCLLIVSLKFELLGSFVYCSGNKPPLEVYIGILFEGRYGTIDEVAEKLAQIVGQPVSEAHVKRVFRKLLFVIYTCCPCMADDSEIWWASTYRCFLECAVEHDEFSFPVCEGKTNLWESMPEGLSKHEQKRKFVLDRVPKELADRVLETDSLLFSIRI